MSEKIDETFDAYRKIIDKSNEAQSEFIRQFSNMQQNTVQNFFATLQGLTFNNAMFKTTVQRGGRLSIPEAERQTLNIEEGDLVQVIIIPIERKKKGNDNT